MISSNINVDTLEKLSRTAIKKHLGDISRLSKDLAVHVERVYLEFISVYLNVLRQKENKPRDWFPQTWSIDPELANDMLHFFSDYQHIAKEFFLLNARLDRLAEIDKERQPNLYRHTIDDILELRDHPLNLGDRLTFKVFSPALRNW